MRHLPAALLMVLLTAACERPIIQPASSPELTASATPTRFVFTSPPLSTFRFTSLIDDLLGRIDRQYDSAVGTVISRVAGTADGRPVTGTHVWWSDPPLIRTDLTLTAAGGTTYASSYLRPDGAYACVAAAVGEVRSFAPDQIACAPVDRLELLRKARSEAIDGRIRESRQSYSARLAQPVVLGNESADCFDVSRLTVSRPPLVLPSRGASATPRPSATTVLVDHGRYCYTYAGLLLYARVRQGGTDLIFEATEIRATVDRSVFDLPK